MSDQDHNSEHEKNSLDLGLSTLIDNASKSIGGETAVPAEQPASLAEVLKSSAERAANALEENSTVTDEHGQYEKLSEKQRWKELATYCEERLAKSGDQDYEAKLWWVKCQHVEKKIPLSILAPSLESASRIMFNDRAKFQSEPRLGRLATMVSNLLQEFASRLQSDGDSELALVLAERSYRLDSSKHSTLKNLIKTQIAGVGGQGPSGSEDHISSIKRLSIELMLPNGAPIKKGPDGIAHQAKQVEQKAEAGFFRKHHRELLVGLAALALLGYGLIVGTRYTLNYLHRSETESLALKPALDLENGPVTLLTSAPFPERLNGLTHLDAVYYDFNQGGNSASPGASSDAGPPEKDSTPINVAQNSSLPSSVPPQLSDRSTARAPREVNVGKEVVNTSSPVIAPEFPKFEQDDDTADELPTIEFPPFRQKPSGGSRRASSDDGFAAPRRYVVIAQTKVMEEPSYYAFSPADLYEGDEIQVEADLGKWLRIRTRRGGIAYVLTQDAKPVAGR